jgi:hypothetical protein
MLVIAVSAALTVGFLAGLLSFKIKNPGVPPAVTRCAALTAPPAALPAGPGHTTIPRWT